MDLADQNRQVFDSNLVVSHYQGLDQLFPPEQTIFSLLRDQLPDWRLLDVGVGAGRTTRHLAPLVKEYWGIDYAPGMIATCRQIFPAYNFLVADARAMPQVPEDSIDLVLISFNGVDYCGPEERGQILREVWRVLKAGGYFCFSSHNLRAAPAIFAFRGSWNPIIFWRRWQRWRRLRRLNAAFLARAAPGDFAILNDGAHNYQIWHYYILPEAQIRQLADAGFTAIRLFSLDGRELTDPEAIAADTGYMIYYLCRKPAAGG